MKLDWMGEYRQVIEAMIGMGNAYSQVANAQLFTAGDVSLSPSELQVMEYILENEDRHENMSRIAQRLSISQSVFSKQVKQLVKKGMLEKYHTRKNNKDIIVKVSQKGQEFYAEYCSGEPTDVWRRIFARLEALDSDTIQIFVDSMNEFTNEILYGKKGKFSQTDDASDLVKIE